jgi:hypothetical protein
MISWPGKEIADGADELLDCLVRFGMRQAEQPVLFYEQDAPMHREDALLKSCRTPTRRVPSAKGEITSTACRRSGHHSRRPRWSTPRSRSEMASAVLNGVSTFGERY